MQKQPGFEKRRDLYLLYHYVNHYNLFSSWYRSTAMSIIENYLWMLKVARDGRSLATIIQGEGSPLVLVGTGQHQFVGGGAGVPPY